MLFCLLKKSFVFYLWYVGVCHVCVNTQGGQKKASGPLKWGSVKSKLLDMGADSKSQPPLQLLSRLRK